MKMTQLQGRWRHCSATGRGRTLIVQEPKIRPRTALKNIHPASHQALKKMHPANRQLAAILIMTRILPPTTLTPALITVTMSTAIIENAPTNEGVRINVNASISGIGGTVQVIGNVPLSGIESTSGSAGIIGNVQTRGNVQTSGSVQTSGNAPVIANVLINRNAWTSESGPISADYPPNTTAITHYRPVPLTQEQPWQVTPEGLPTHRNTLCNLRINHALLHRYPLTVPVPRFWVVLCHMEVVHRLMVVEVARLRAGLGDPVLLMPTTTMDWLRLREDHLLPLSIPAIIITFTPLTMEVV